MALAEAGRCEEAVRIQKELVALAEKLENEELATRLRVDLVRYEAGSPCRPTSEQTNSESPATVPEPAPEPKGEGVNLADEIPKPKAENQSQSPVAAEVEPSNRQ